MPRLTPNLFLQQLRTAGDDAERFSDGELLQRFAVRRDETAFDALLSRYAPLVWGLCRRQLRHREDAEDAFQATFLTLARNAASVRKPESLGSWLYGIANRITATIRVRDHGRQRRELGAARSEATDALDELSGRELCAVLDQELGKLPPKYREPLILCHLQGWTRDEAARRLGLSLGTLKRRLEQGRDLLRNRITRRGLTLSAGLLGGLLAHAALSEAAPAALAAATVRAAIPFATGAAPLGSVSAASLSLARDTLRTFWLARLKVGAAVGILLPVVLLALFSLGVRGAREEPVSISPPPNAPPIAEDPVPPPPPTASEIEPPPILAVAFSEVESSWVNGDETSFAPVRPRNRPAPGSIQEERIRACRSYVLPARSSGAP